jgi:hypothetical protein
MPRKARRLAVRSVLSGKLADGQLVIVDGFEELEPRTRSMIEALKALNINDSSALIFTTGGEVNLQLAAGNLPRVKMMSAQFLSVVDMLKHDFVIMPRAAIEVVTGILGNTGGRRKLVLRVKGETNGRAKTPATAATTTTTAKPSRSKKAAATAEATAENVAFEPTGEVAEAAAATEVETTARPKAAARTKAEPKAKAEAKPKAEPKPKAAAKAKAAPKAKKSDETAAPKKATAKKSTTGESATENESEG